MSIRSSADVPGRVFRSHGIRLVRTHVLQRRPAVTARPDEDQVFERGAVGADLFDLLGMLGGHDGEPRARPVDPVFDILGGEQVGARHGDDSGFCAAEQHLIPFDDARDHHEGEIAPFPRRASSGHWRSCSTAGRDPNSCDGRRPRRCGRSRSAPSCRFSRPRRAMTSKAKLKSSGTSSEKSARLAA